MQHLKVTQIGYNMVPRASFSSWLPQNHLDKALVNKLIYGTCEVVLIYFGTGSKLYFKLILNGTI